MPKALVCITTDMDSADDVLKRLKTCEGVEEAFRVHGVYDIIAKIKGDSGDKLKRVLNDKILGLEKIQKTLTMMIAEPEYSP